jgi:hypothetical protein
MSFLDAIIANVQRKLGRTKETCPLAKGAVCIVASRLDNNAGIENVQVTLSGPTPGNSGTDTNGISQFDDRNPGSYRFKAELSGPRRGHWKMQPYVEDLAVAGGQVAIADVFAYPTGDLKIEIYDDQTSKLIAEAATVAASGGQTMRDKVQSGTHSFKGIMAGSYEATVIAPDQYMASDKTEKVTVPEGSEGKAVFRLKRKSWIKVRVVDEKSGQDVKASLKLKLLDGMEANHLTDGKDALHITMSRMSGTCSVQQALDDTDEIYEVMKVDSA